MTELNLTRNVLKVFSVFVNNPRTDLYGLEISERTGIAYGALLPLLIRLEEGGWLVGEWENIDPAVAGRPKRKYFRMSEEGMARAKRLVAEEVAFLSGRVQTA
jgi:PadR family transcriptional regulator, regulatory protein PadR